MIKSSNIRLHNLFFGSFSEKASHYWDLLAGETYEADHKHICYLVVVFCMMHLCKPHDSTTPEQCCDFSSSVFLKIKQTEKKVSIKWFSDYLLKIKRHNEYLKIGISNTKNIVTVEFCWLLMSLRCFIIITTFFPVCISNYCTKIFRLSISFLYSSICAFSSGVIH